MAKRGKRYQEIAKRAPQEPVELDAAIEFLKANPAANFDETVDMSLRMGVDPRKSDQAIRGTIVLPHGTGKKISVLVFAQGDAADAAREAGADHVGMDDMVEKVKGGWTGFDVAVATPEAMKEVRKLGRVLGPRGLMPNPKTGTVTDDTATAVKNSLAGKVDFRMDRHGNICVLFGKLSFEKEKLVENAQALLRAIEAERPASARGHFYRGCTVSSSMGVGVNVIVTES